MNHFLEILIDPVEIDIIDRYCPDQYRRYLFNKEDYSLEYYRKFKNAYSLSHIHKLPYEECNSAQIMNNMMKSMNPSFQKPTELSIELSIEAKIFYDKLYDMADALIIRILFDDKIFLKTIKLLLQFDTTIPKIRIIFYICYYFLISKSNKKYDKFFTQVVLKLQEIQQHANSDIYFVDIELERYLEVFTKFLK